MNKREFLRILGLGTLGLTSGSLFLNRCTKTKAPAKNWAWISANRYSSPDEWKRIFERMKKHGIDAALVLAGKETIETILPIGKQTDIEMHNWIITLECRDEEIIKNHPDWFTINRNGVSSLEKPPYVPSYKWLCPSQKEVQEYVQSIVSELADFDDLKGIHLDYIRHPDVILPIGIQPRYNLVQDKEYPEFDFCYCPVCRELFKEKEGIDPLELEEPTSSAAWGQFRYDSITNLVNQLSVVAHQKNKMLTAAVFPSPAIARRMVHQDWPRWHVDAVLPMMYHKYYNENVEWIEKVTREGVESLSSNTKLYSGLHISMLTPGELAKATEFAFEGGANGIVLFTATAMTDEHWESLDRVLHNT